MKKFSLTALTALTLALSACGNQGEEATADSVGMVAETNNEAVVSECNRDCILGITETYLSALAAHDPSAAALADNIAFVENIIPMSPGEGLWQTVVSAPSNFAVYVPDEENQTAGFIGMLTYMTTPPAPQGASPEEREAFAASAEKVEQPAIFALRLKLENGEITEVEHLVAGIRPAFMGTLETPRAGLLSDVPAGQRTSHDELITIGLSYYDALDDNDGTLMDFADDCERHENGMITAGADAGAGPNGAGTGSVARDCAGQLTSQAMAYIDRIENRRVFAADPMSGLVMGLSHFRHSMDVTEYDVINMDGTIDHREIAFDPFDLPAAHIFKIGADGQVHEIEAMGFQAPYNAPTGWE